MVGGRVRYRPPGVTAVALLLIASSTLLVLEGALLIYLAFPFPVCSVFLFGLAGGGILVAEAVDRMAPWSGGTTLVIAVAAGILGFPLATTASVAIWYNLSKPHVRWALGPASAYAIECRSCHTFVPVGPYCQACGLVLPAGSPPPAPPERA